ncbi:Smr/MutS family protein [Bordetella sp. 02P26C-1]|uniref:Smr/MutS family protein n=1 Tax=Bordetella sp. 02P26C-1 TaxID=2683195 RepID=UPI001353FB6D|nr:Smr/MutS family protein [Bordetella sp. 02P26C-1]MVW77502.1 DNA mismatch repair protein MutS [Bordetella sp. 02P26C-1]
MRNNKGGLADLKRLQQTLQRSRAEAERAAREAAARAADVDPDAFRKATQSVTPLKPTGRREVRPDTAKTLSAGTVVRKPIDESVAMRRAAAMGETLSRADAGLSDGADVAHLLSEGGTAFVRADAAPDTARNLRRGQWPAGAELDLHGLRVEQARHAVVSFLDECLEHGIRCVRIVHGKGYGSQGLEPVLKDKVRTWLVQKADVMAFSEASEREGGAGALLVLLRQTGTRRA